MLRPRSTVIYSLRLLTLAAACAWSTVYADDYVDVDQLRKAKNYAAALAKANNYLATKPSDPQMRFLKGLIQRESGKTSDAVSTFTKLTEDYAELPEPYNNLAVIYAEQNQFDKAQALLERAIRTNPSYATAHENLGDIHARLADQAYRAALQLDGASPDIRPKLALLNDIFSPAQRGKSTGTVVAAAQPRPAPLTPSAPPLPPSKPTVAPAAAVPSEVAAALPEKPSATGSGQTAAVESAIYGWAKAWASKDVAGYLRAYDKKFDPPGKASRSAWEQERRGRIEGKAMISVRIEALAVEVNGDTAIARFRQDYKAGALEITGRKKLELIKTGDRWLIVKEVAGS